MDPPKNILCDRYRVISLLGRGGMGSVWLGEQMSLGTMVAIKLLDPRLAESEVLRARFLREARAAATLRSANVVQVIDHGVDGDTPFIVMELLQGESLGTRLRRDKTIAPKDLTKVFNGVGRAIARAHKAGIVHRDLKPDNIFLARDEDDAEIVKVVDFGIAKILESDGVSEVSTETGALMGTLYYMSPEQARGAKKVDGRADLWAMAIIAFECLVGRRPFVGTAAGELVLMICSDPVPIPSEVSSVPAGFDAWFARATLRPIEQRFQTVSELVRSLEDVLTPGEHAFSDAGGDATRSLDPVEIGSEPTVAAVHPSSSSVDARMGVKASQESPVATDGNVTSSLLPHPRSSAFRWVALLVLAVVAAPTSYWLATRKSAPEPTAKDASKTDPESPHAPAFSMTEAVSARAISSASTAPPATSETAARRVTLQIASKPPGVEVRRGADRLGIAPDPIVIPYGTEAVTLTFEKKGFKKHEIKIVPDKDQSVEVNLDVLPARSDDYGF